MNPAATYRVQLNKDFDFNKLKATLPYLAKLGISHVCASPIFKARRGSMHGYDALDTNVVSEELGGSEAFDALLKEAATVGIGWIQDIVPNHIAYSPESTIVSNIMQFGTSSVCHDFLDVDWNYPSPQLHGKIFAPFLEGSYEENLQQDKIKLVYRDGFKIKYGDMEFPIKISSYRKILAGKSGASSFLFEDEKSLLLKLRQNYSSDAVLKSQIKQVLDQYNQDYNILDQLLSEQVYALADWRSAFREINYRRFFNITDLICLRMEDKKVYEATHRLILQLLSENKIVGLRVDHVDGLCDPEEYLKRLRKAAPQKYLVAEKILLGNENLPESWPIEGTTGYDFLNKLNGLFVATKNKTKMNIIYEEFTKNKKTFRAILDKSKKTTIQQYFASDIENLTRLFHQNLMSRPYGEKCTKEGVREALAELISTFSVYRTYVSENNATGKEKAVFEGFVETAKKRNRELPELEAIEMLLHEGAVSKDALQTVMRLQQFTGPIMAKGLEDMALYVYTRLLSLNDVGGEPEKFGLSQNMFHRFLMSRQQKWPLTLNATSTHDTKRGEDTRARINVLSEMPSEFYVEIRKWAAMNAKKKKNVDCKPVPNANEEYYIYQTLIGSFPFEPAELPEFKNRLAKHMTKALREAKVNSTWLNPNLKYEEAVTSFVKELLEINGQNMFLREFTSFQKKTAFYGFLNSLSQTLIKIASPGIPDFYQGTELWDLNMVDPDNRRQVDFQKRQKCLDEVQNLKSPSEIQELLNGFEDGRVKIYEIQKALKIRTQNRNLFLEGDYIPLKIKGTYKNHIFAFCRKKENSLAVIVAPRLLASLTNLGQLPLGDLWKDTFVCLPGGSAKRWSEIFSEESVVSKKNGGNEGFGVADLLRAFPVALLLAGES